MTGVKSKLEFGSLDATLNRVPYALTLSDLDAEDQPLVFMNQSFRDMTGTTDAHLGRNCRFLQSDLENEQARAEIRLALAEDRRTQVILRNRRTNGETFHNLLLLEPLKSTGMFAKIALGAQFELTEEEVAGFRQMPASLNTLHARAITDSALQLRLEGRRIATNSAVQLVQSWITLKSLSV